MRRHNPYNRRWLTPRPELVTDQERAAGSLIASGLSRPEVAARLGIEPGTVQNLLRNLYMKLHLPGYVALTHYAIAHGWIAVIGRAGPIRKRR